MRRLRKSYNIYLMKRIIIRPAIGIAILLILFLISLSLIIERTKNVAEAWNENRELISKL